MTSFIRGDTNTDGGQDLSDAVFILNHLFLGGAAPRCIKSGDTNDDGSLDLSDAVSLLNFLFLGGMRPGDPFPDCGNDPTTDELSCVSNEVCN